MSRLKEWYQKLPPAQKIILGAALLYVGITLMIA